MDSLLKKLNRQFHLKRTIPKQIVENIIQYRPVIKKTIPEWTLMIVVFILKNYKKTVSLYLNDDLRVQIRIIKNSTVLMMTNDDPDNNIFFSKTFKGTSDYPTTPALRLLYHILLKFKLSFSFNAFSDMIVYYLKELEMNIPKMKLYWKRLVHIPKKVIPEEEEFFRFISVFPAHTNKTMYSFQEYIDLFPEITQQQALQHLMQQD